MAHVAAVPAGALPYPTVKRVALARALISSPRLLLLDEPAGGLGISASASWRRRDAGAAAAVQPHAHRAAGLGV